MNAKALIVGSAGQDGILLSSFLDRKGYTVIKIAKGDIDIESMEDVENCLSLNHPDEIYYLAAYHHSSQAKDNLNSDKSRFMGVNCVAAVNFLESIRAQSLSCKFFYASSSHVFSPRGSSPQNEMSLLSPDTPYAESKIAAMKECEAYREKHGIHASVGILYNHESAHRRSDFVSKKITSFVAGLCRGEEGTLELGDLDSVVDWGDAEDFVEAFWLVLQQPKPDNFVIATGVGHSVRDFVEYAFSSKGFDYKKFVRAKAVTAGTSFVRIGDISKLTAMTGWKPRTSFQSMIDKMITADLTQKQSKV